MSRSVPFFLESPQRRAARRRSRLWWGLTSLLVLLAVIVAAVTLMPPYVAKRKVAPSGGLYFVKRVELPVPLFSQGDPAWGEDPLGPTDQTMGEAGCAVTSAAMVLRFYGVDADPGRLNAYCDAHEGYTPQGWLYWEKAAEFAGGGVRHVYEDLPSYWLLDSNLLRGNPVIVRVRLPNGITHFVVVMGKDGFDYLIRDPAGAGRTRGVYPLKDYRSEVEALRYYEKTSAAVARAADVIRGG